jgi:hypothetical protein
MDHDLYDAMLIAARSGATLDTLVDHLLDRAGNPGLLTDGLKGVLVSHSGGNPRILCSMVADLLAAAVHQDHPHLDEQLFLEVFDRAVAHTRSASCNPDRTRSPIRQPHPGRPRPRPSKASRAGPPRAAGVPPASPHRHVHDPPWRRRPRGPTVAPGPWHCSGRAGPSPPDRSPPTASGRAEDAGSESDYAWRPSANVTGGPSARVIGLSASSHVSMKDFLRHEGPGADGPGSHQRSRTHRGRPWRECPRLTS